MTSWVDRILKEFPVDVARLWLVADPDDVLLDEQILSGLRERGFGVLPFEDSIAFRAEYEEVYRAAWDRGASGPCQALILHLRGTNIEELPWDYLRQGRKVRLSLAELFPRLSYTVLKQLGSELLPELFEAHSKYASQPLGETATKEFVLTHIFGINPHLIHRREDFWRELLRLHYRDVALPLVLAEHLQQVLTEREDLKGIPITDLFAQKSFALRVVQDGWQRYLEKLGVTGTRIGEPAPPDYVPKLDVPFEHHDVRALVGSMFIDGTLHPLRTRSIPNDLPEWVKTGVVQDPLSMRTLVLEGIANLQRDLPAPNSSYRDWAHFSRRVGELIFRFHSLDTAHVESVKDDMAALVRAADERLRHWVAEHYADLPSLPVAKRPVMVHHVPRYLAMRRANGEEKIALVVFDGLAVDQWTLIRECISHRAPHLMFDEGVCIAWLPTLTSVSRQALFSGLRPREFADSIDTTSKEARHWMRFWEDQGLRPAEILYRRSIRRTEDLPELNTQLSNPACMVAGLVVDTVDEIIHGAVLGKRGVAAQIRSWCESGFVDSLVTMLLDNGFHVYLTADHGNTEAVGIGRPSEGAASEVRGERVRTYQSEPLIAGTAAVISQTFRTNLNGLPEDFLVLFAEGRGAFVPEGELVVAHGGMSVEELFVPFVKVRWVS